MAQHRFQTSAPLLGNGPPAADTGNFGDLYRDISAGVEYGPKTSAGWGSGRSIVGPQGENAYERAVANGFSGTEQQWLASLEGPPGDEGPSAYEVAVANGFGGTEAEWLASLEGPPGDPGTTSWTGITDKPSSFAPSPHKASHATGAADAIAPADIGAAAAHSHPYAPASHVGSRDGHPLATTTQNGLQAGADKSSYDAHIVAQNQRVSVRRNTALAVSSGTSTDIPWQSEVSDSAGFFDLSDPLQIYIPADGLYLVGFSMQFDNMTASAPRVAFFIQVSFAAGGSTVLQWEENSGVSGGYPGTMTSYPVELKAGDQIRYRAYQNSGSTQNVRDNAQASIARLL